MRGQPTAEEEEQTAAADQRLHSVDSPAMSTAFAVAVAAVPPPAAEQTAGPGQFPTNSLGQQQQTAAAPSPSASSQQPQPLVVVTRRERPAVPPKPQLDIVRFSMAQARDELDLDTILTELLELETQLSGEAGDRFLLGLPSLPQAARSQQHQAQSAGHLPSNKPLLLSAVPVEQMAKKVQFQQFIGSTAQQQNSVDCARLPSSGGGSEFCASPDADSAFGDSSSTESAHAPMPNGGGRLMLCPEGPSNGQHQQQRGGGGGGGGGHQHSESLFSSADSFRGSLLNTPSPSQHQAILPTTANGVPSHPPNGPMPSRPPSSADSYASAASNRDEQKKAKIREALEKMKEAKMKKVFVKIFLEDGSQRGLLLDERWTVAETMRQLADKTNCVLSAEHAIVEEYPHLHIKRVYEDDEFAVQNLEDWTADSPNKLHFVRLPQKWALFRQPQLFLLTERNRNEFPPADAANSADWNWQQRQRLLDSYLVEEGGSRVPELEGWLLLKADGKKCWRRHFFVLRASGLYFVAKPGKAKGPARNLQCLMSVFNSQVYTCTDWRRKYKAPTDWGFAIKHPRVQVKTSKYIKYICAEDEPTFLQWITALRIIKNGCPTLYKNFCAAQQSSQGRSTSVGAGVPVRVEVPQVPLQRLSSAMDPTNSATQSPRHYKLGFQQQPIGGYPSPVTLRTAFMASRASGDDSSRNSSPIRTGFAFEQDECNTIKRRQPELLANNEQQQQHHNDLCTSVLLCQSEANFCFDTPTTSSATLPGTIGSVFLAESDSDEEAPFPPPPANGTPIQHESPHRVSQAASSTQPSCGSPWRTNNKLPPPPPKRSDGTRLHSPCIGADTGRNMQMNLMAELQMATSRQKMRLEQNL